MKKILSFALCLAILVSVFVVFPTSVAAAGSGIFGRDMKWILDAETGDLVISGNGDANFSDAGFWFFQIDPLRVRAISFEEGVTSVCGWCFEGFENLETISIPSTAISIADNTFFCDNCNTTLLIARENPVYSSEGNCLIDKSAKKLISGADDFVIPDDGSVETIADEAFFGRAGVRSVNLPSSVRSIGFAAFTGCTELETITADPENPVFVAVDNCLIEKETGTLILGCKNSVIPDDGSVKVIGDAAFGMCHSFSEIEIPDSVQKIGAYAFSECSALSEVILPNGLEIIDEGAFCGCASLSEMYVPDSVNVVGPNAFAWCSSMSSIRLPEGLKEIASHAFEGCELLDNVIIPDGAEIIDSYGFALCHSLKNIKIANSVKEIGEAAFFECTELEEIGLPNSLEMLGGAAFQDCDSLENIILPETVVEIGDDAFSDTGIVFTEYGNALYIGSEDDPYYALVSSADMFIEACEIHPDTKIICDGAFSWNENLEEISIPEGVETIGEGAFGKCSGIEKVVIPSGVKKIGAGAFGGCAQLKSITMPVRLLLIAPEIFADCTSVNDLSCEGTPEEFEEVLSMCDDSFFAGVKVHIAEDDPDILRGDINGDGAINSRDITLLKKFISGIVELDEDAAERADVNADGHINAQDLNLLKKMITGLI
jgi:hypothetical protein